MISHPAFDVAHLAGNSCHKTEYGFQAGTLTSSLTGTGSPLVVGYTDLNGPGFYMGVGAHSGTVQFAGPTIRRDAVKAVILDIEGITYTGTGSPLWGAGFYATDGSVVDLFRDTTGVALTSQIISGTQRSQQKTALGDNTVVKNGRAGLMIDYTTGKSYAHMGYSMVSVTGNQPTANLELRLRALTLATQQNFGVYMRKVTLTVIR